MNDGEVLIRAEHVSKKFCRSLKRSLWYGAQDLASALLPWKRDGRVAQDAEGAEFQEPELRKDEFWAVRDVSFEVRRGECMGLIGHNGAGKSTLLKMLNSLIWPDTGRITMKGRVGALIELSAGFNPILTGRENIYNQAALLGFSRNQTIQKFDAIVDFSELEDFLDTPVQNYSSGMRVKLGFAIASQMEPDVLLLDEILAVGDVSFRFKCINAMARTLQHSAVVFVSHSMPQMYRVANSIMVLHGGVPSGFSNDVSGGIHHYYAISSKPTESVTGSGDVVVTKLQLDSHPRDRATPDQPVTVDPGDWIELTLTLMLKPSVQSARVQALLWNQEMIPVAEIVTTDGKGYLIKRQSQSASNCNLRIKIPPLHLNGGPHMLSVNVVSEDYQTVYCRHDNAVVLNVQNANVSGANVIVPAAWTVVN